MSDSNNPQQPQDPQPQYPQSQYQQPAYQQQGPMQWPHMTIGNWIVTMLLLLIPIVNIVLMFVWAFGGNTNPSKKTYFQAQLIFVAIGIVLTIIAWGALLALFASLGGMLY